MSAGPYLFAWRIAGKIPLPIAQALANRAADAAWLKRGKGVRRLESNLAKVRPDLSATQIRRLSRAGMRSYVRYYYESFTLHDATAEQLQARVRLTGGEHVERVISGAASAVLAIGHMANWDLAGAWACVNLAPVVAVVERLEPADLFEKFLEFRSSVGMKVLPLGDPGVFDALVEAANRVAPPVETARPNRVVEPVETPRPNRVVEPVETPRTRGQTNQPTNVVIALVADRDLTSRGVEVNLAGQRARVAAGPATVALAAEIDLIPVVLYYERLTGERRRAAGTEWGVVMECHPAVPVPTPNPALPPQDQRREQVAQMMQYWADVIGAGIARHPQDWHMLQRVFVDDLDPDVATPVRLDG